MQSRQVSNFKINKMTKAQYSSIVPSQDEVYITTDEADAVLSVNGILPNAQGNVTINIPAAVTEATVAGWGFTKNVGTVTSVNGNQPDGSGNVAITIPDISNLADKDLSNLSVTGKKVIDGQWVQSNGTVISAASGQATGTYSFSLSSYLPNDSYSYEVILNVVAKTASNYNGIVFKSDYIAPPYTTASYSQFICTTTTTAGNLIMPIGSNRNLDYVIGSNGTDYLYIRLYAYRRIGTNG